MENEFMGVGGNKDRIYISASWGCRYHCKYCYLGEMGVYGVTRYYSVNEILNEISKQNIFIPGRKGSIITIGCYSECMDEINKTVTMKLICYFLEKNNYVQLATKKRIEIKDLIEIKKHIQYEKQMFLCVSLPTLSHADFFEPDIDKPICRIKNLDVRNKYGVEPCLYIKPFMDGITVEDLDSYIQLIKQFKPSVIVGKRMHIYRGIGEKLYISHTAMAENHSCEINKFVNALRKITDVYAHSCEPIFRARSEMECK